MKKRTKAILLNTIALLAIYFFTTILIANKGVYN